MSIARACYVTCDLCGDPAPVSVWGAKSARVVAAKYGWKRITGRDICPRHIVWETDEHERRTWHIEPLERAR